MEPYRIAVGFTSIMALFTEMHRIGVYLLYVTFTVVHIEHVKPIKGPLMLLIYSDGKGIGAYE